MNRFLTISLVLLVVCNTSFFVQGNTLNENNTASLIKEITFSQPTISSIGNFTAITLSETSGHTTEANEPDLPVYIEIFTFPFGTNITSVSCTFQTSYWMSLQQEVKPVQQPLIKDTSLQDQIANQSKKETSYITGEQYPSHRYEYHLGTGLQGSERVLFVVVQYYPIIYHPSNQTISGTSSMTIQVDYDLKSDQASQFCESDIDLVVIAPAAFEDALSPLVFHKKSIGTDTIFQSLEDIYNAYPGRDKAEQIKYYIKEMIELHGISFVLLVGDIYTVPIRTSNVSIFGRWEHAVLSDLYFADIYDGTGGFSSWDTDHDNIFGETDEDSVDLYPDVHVGRLPCSTIEEVSLIVDKIITYEQNTFGQDWFHQMIFIGGNTFPNLFQPGNEGEKHNLQVMDIMQDFTASSIIWTSKRNFNPIAINRGINKGAGFIDYSGHGFEHGIGTYKPHGRHLKTYLTPYIEGLRNGYKLPIIFFDACLTAKLDFVLQDVLDYKQYRIFDILAKILDYNTSLKLPCFAYSFLKHPNGGAIATIGATRTAFGGEDFGCEKLSVEFFSAYERGIQLGEMLSTAQTMYRHQLPTDEFTLEEFVLLGDPSLHVGGYSDDTEPPTISLLNPRVDWIHIKGVPLIPANEIVVLGGFQWKPIQIEVSDNVDEIKDIAVSVTIENKLDQRLEFNRFKKIYEVSWDGFGVGRFTMNITAIDMSGNKAFLELPLRYICFHLHT